MDTKSLFKKVVNLVTLASFVVWNLAAATPEGGSVTQGSAAITQSGSTTTVIQTSSKAVINWNSFDTSSNEAVKFIQSGTNAIALNKINSGLPTNFNGSLSANGQIWILNPAGVLFGAGSKVDVSGLLVTTHNITDSNFMSGNYRFTLDPHFINSQIINNGSITVENAGMAALVAPSVINNGIIMATLGTVQLSTGANFVLDLNGDGLINFGSNTPIANGSVSNNGVIQADGGKVYMTANAAAGLLDNVISMSGTIQARSVANGPHGQIILNGGHAGKVKVSGTLNTSGDSPSAEGGNIETSGYDLELAGADIKTGVGGNWLLDPPTIYTSTWGSLIADQLNAGTNVTLSTGVSGAGAGDIYVDAAINWSTSAVLMLGAYRDINISAPITASNNGGFIARADLSANGTGTVNFSGSGSVTVNGANGYAKLFYNPTGGNYATPTNYTGFLLGSAPIKAGYMMINTQADLLAAGAVGSSSIVYSYALNNDIDMTGVPLSSSLFNSGFGNNFKGNFEGHNYADGLNKTISNITLSTGGGVGSLMTYLNGRIDNLSLSNLSLTAGGNYGGLVWSNNGTISNVHVSGNLVGTSFSGGGGITGENQGVIKNSWFSGSINSAGLLYIGGITGYLNAGASIIDSYNEGAVTGAVAGGIVGLMIGVSTITNVYNVGAISGGSAIIGAANVAGSAITGAYWNTTTSSTGSAYGGGFAGSYSATALNDANMKIAANFPTFDFLNTWTTNSDTTYPQLITLPNIIINSTQFAGSLGLSAAGQTVNIYADNVFVGSAIVQPNGEYYVNFEPNAVYISNPTIILATTSGAVTGDYLGKFYGPVGNMDIVNNQVTVRSDTGFAMQNSEIAGLSNANLFVGSGNDILLNPTASYLTTAGVVYSPVFSTTATTYYINGDITQGVDVTFNGPVFATAANSNIINTGNTIFFSTLDGPGTLTINDSLGTVTFNNLVGDNIALDNLYVTANQININAAAIKSVAEQVYTGSVVLMANTELTSANSSINFNLDINGPFDLIVNAGTTALFGSYVTSTSSLMKSLTVTAPSGITIVSNVDGVNNLSTLNDMTFNSIMFGGPYTLVNLSTTSGGDITLSAYQSLTDYFSRNNLNINSSGSITLKGDITLTCPVGVFPVGATFTATNAINIDGASNIFALVSGVTFNGKVVLYNDVNISGWFSGVFFNDTVNDSVSGTHSLSVGLLNNGAASTFTFANAFGDSKPLANLTISTPASSINFNAPIDVLGTFTVQASNGDVAFNAAMTLQPSSQWIVNGGNVFVNAPIDGSGHLHINTVNSSVLNAPVGATTPLEDVDVAGSQINIATSGVTTNGSQVYSGPVILSVNSALTSNNSDITFNSTVEGPGGLVANVNNGTMFANGHMGFGGNPLGYLTVNGTAEGVNIISVGDINMGPFNVVTNDLVQSLAGNVNFTGGPVTLFANLDVVAAEQIFFGAGANGVTGPFALSAQSLNPVYGPTGQGVTGTVNVANLTVGGPGGANLSQNYPTTESFVATQGAGQAFTNTVISPDFTSSGTIYCVNNFCSLLPTNNTPTNIPPTQFFHIPSTKSCDASGCSNLITVIDNLMEAGIVSCGSTPAGGPTCQYGFAQAEDTNGKIRILMPGDVVYAGDKILKDESSCMCVKSLYSKKRMCMGSGKNQMTYDR